MIPRILPTVLAGLCIAIPWAWAQNTQPTEPPKHGGAYRRPLANNPSTLDPALITDTYGHTVAQQIFDGLVQYDTSLIIIPAIAESWKATRDGLSWTFLLRKGVKFHNGREVVADDVVYSFTRILDPKTRSNAAELFLKIRGAKDYAEGRAKTVRGVRALDRNTVQIELAEASAPFVASLAIGYAKIVPRELVEELGPGFGSRPVGTGPFKFIRWKKDEEIVLEANQDYYGGRPFLDRIEYKIYPGHRSDEMLVNFENGELEDTFIPPAYWARAQEIRRYRFVQRPILGVRFFGLTTSHPPLSNRLIRQAFSHAIDRDALVREVLQGRFVAGKSFLPPGTYGYDPQYRPYPFDPQRSRALLAKAGYPGGKGLPVFQVWSSVKSADVEREHEVIKQYLADVGIRVEFHYNTNWPAFKSQVYDGKLPIFRYGWVADVPEPENFLYRLFHSQSRNNLTRYHNKRVDLILDRARAEQGYLKRVELYREAEKLIMEDAPIIPLNYYSYERLFQPYVRSIEVSALGDPYIPMRKIWLAK
jgi:peptide/nickel transport system substrate-binding protein/oligopeptide transport system substrate-binding protein